jgi:cytochrome oxidase assembly protein ShyY1
MWDFARRPKWILSHILVVVLIITMINLGFWQLRRLDEKTRLNDNIRSRGALAVEPIETLVPAGSTRASTHDFAWRPVQITGTYRPADELVVSNRTLNGAPGFWVLTPLVERDGSIVPIVRGFIYRQDFEKRGLAGLDAPTGEVTLTGRLQTSPGGGRFGEERSDAGAIPAIAQVDVGRLATRWGDAVLPMWVRLEAGPGAPSDAGPLYPVPPPPLSKGPHLSYAIQWFIFSTIALIGYPLILRKRSRQGDDDDVPAAAVDLTQKARHNGSASGTMVPTPGRKQWPASDE